MGAFALAAVALGSGALAAGQQYRAGKQMQIQYKQEAAQEGDQARQREIERKRNLLRALASQRASAAASGANMEGSLANLAQVDIEQAANDLEYDTVNSSRRGRVLRSAGREAVQSGTIAAGASLLDSGVNTYKSLG
jgi:hypothetical protein